MSFFNNLIIQKNLKRYNVNELKYCIMKINTIIYNKKSHYVSKFKNYLFLNDLTEFLIKYYKKTLIIIFFKKFFLYQKHLISPCLIDKKIMKIMNKNLQQKKIFNKIKKEEKNIKNNRKEYSNILNTIITNSTIIETQKDDFNTETTIDNIHANDDITISLDLRINQNYDFKEIEKDINFVKEKNNNDKTILNIMNIIDKKKIQSYINSNSKSPKFNKKLDNSLLNITKIRLKNSKTKPIKCSSSKHSINISQSSLIQKEKDKKIIIKPLKTIVNSYYIKKTENSKSKIQKIKSLDFHLSELSSRAKKKRNVSTKFQSQSISTNFNSKGSNDSKKLNKDKKKIRDTSKIGIKISYENIFGKSRKDILKNKNKSLYIQNESLFPSSTPLNIREKPIKKINKLKNFFFSHYTSIFNSSKKIYHSSVQSLIENETSIKKNHSNKKFIISLNKTKKSNLKLNDSGSNRKN